MSIRLFKILYIIMLSLPNLLSLSRTKSSLFNTVVTLLAQEYLLHDKKVLSYVQIMHSDICGV